LICAQLYYLTCIGQYEACTQFFSRSSAHARESNDPSRHSFVPWWGLLLSGGFAGAFSWLTTFPFDVVKTRVQSTYDGSITPLSSQHSAAASIRAFDGELMHPRPYRNTWTTIVNSYHAEGPGVFFRGLSPTLIRAIPVNMVTFATFEAVVAMLS
jgi:solute carrier family 25 carnitine/acylcarnitine transporter 20/29